MTILLASEVPISDKNYCQIAINIFQKYVEDNFKSKSF